MRALLSPIVGAVLGAVAGVALCALVGAVWFEIGALQSPNADLRPESAWAMGAIWIGIGYGPFAALIGAVVGFLAGWARGARRAPDIGA